MAKDYGESVVLGQILRSHRRTFLAVGAVVLIPIATLVGIGATLVLTAEYREVATGWEPRGVSADGRTLTILYTTTPQCEELDRVEKRETRPWH
jgi:hypothetical protein